MRLPPSDSDLAQQAFKDPYVFDFVSLTDKRNEHELVGRQVRLTIGEDEFFADLLFTTSNCAASWRSG